MRDIYTQAMAGLSPNIDEARRPMMAQNSNHSLPTAAPRCCSHVAKASTLFCPTSKLVLGVR